jgi:predicted glycogen debranching enzyme
VFRFDLAAGPAVLALAADGAGLEDDAAALFDRLAAGERVRREGFASPLPRAADAYVVARGRGRTIVAGYPWFTDWGRDTFIALRGLCLATGRLDDARAILLEWAGAVHDGLLPNRFADRGEAPEFNAVDASLWFVVAVHECLEAAVGARSGDAADRARLSAAVDAILECHVRGTRHDIRMDADGLLAAGEPGVQLTWMDARVDGRVITPRIGKPVEVQALWINALQIASAWSSRWLAPLARARTSFARFWNAEGSCLFDVVDADHVPGANDATFRPNQVLAVGGLPFAVLADDAKARRVVDAVEARLVTPLGLRSLAPDDPAYVGRYEGGVAERDGAYHQGTVWPWLLGPFVDAWVRVRGGTPEAKAEARRRFLDPLLAHLEAAGLGHLPEIADGDPPHTPRGCPFQAWSVGEALRLDRVVLA